MTQKKLLCTLIYLLTFATPGENFIQTMPAIYCHILPTDRTPEVIFDTEGMLTIKGRAMALNRTAPSEKLLNCIERYLKNPAGTTTVIIELEYLNSFGTQILVDVVRKVSQVLDQGKRLVIKWYYDKEDDDILERGHHISEAFNIPIEFIPTRNHSLFN